MSYDIQLFSIATREREKKLQDENFFEQENNLEPFTEDQFKALRKRLLIYGYIEEQDKGKEIEFVHAGYGIRVLLTQRAVYFTASRNGDAIFEAGLTASEFTDTDEFAKYDPQSGGWEEI